MGRRSTRRTPPASGTNVVLPETYGAVGDGVTDDSVALQACFTAAGLAGGTVNLTKTYRTTRNLYIFGSTNVTASKIGTGSTTGAIILDADLTAADGVEYWINFGIQSKGGTKTVWNGRFSGVSLILTANAVADRMLNVHVGRDCWIEDNYVDVRSCLAPVGFIGCYNNAAWCNGTVKQRLHIVGNTGLAAQTSVNGSEFIGVGNASFVWISDNYGANWGDDGIGLHTVDDFWIYDNYLGLVDGRIYLSGCRRGKVHDNTVQRVQNPDLSWASYSALMQLTIESATQPACADIDIHDNTFIHGTPTGNVYGIRLLGVRRVQVHHNTFHDTSGFGYAVTWQGIQVGSWTDGEALDAAGNARTHELDVTNNKVTGAGANGLIAEQQSFANDMVGPATVTDNDTPGLTTILTPTAYSYVGSVSTFERDWDLPTGAKSQTVPRNTRQDSNNAALSTGRLSLFALPLRKGQTISTISFVSGATALSVGSNQWFSLWSSARAKLGVTNDDTSTAWAANSVKTLTLAVPYVVPRTGLYYVGICVVATTVPTLRGSVISILGGTLSGNATAIEGSADTGLTDPASAPATAAALTQQSILAYAWVS